jgi:CPA2 family monovalent cation:H+ antiporter-2
MDDTLQAMLALLSAAVLAVTIARRFKLPSILAYLTLGVVLGPHGAGVIGSSAMVKTLAEFGVVFLMFSIGLEFSLPKLKAMRSLVFGFGSAQMALTAAGTMLATWVGYDQGWRAGVAVGLAVGMSSTAIVAKLLSEKFDLHSKSGRQTMGVLLFQDLAVVPCLILLPALAKPSESLLYALGAATLQAGVVLFLLVRAGQPLMRGLFDLVARQRSPELFVITTLWLVFSLAWATHAAGLSMALGAFVGGMLISETAYRHQVEADIEPFRDLLLGLFFVSVGMLLDVGYVFSHLPLLALAVALLVLGKGGVVLIVTHFARNRADTALRTAAQLAQAGEFGLVLIELAFSLKLIHADVFQVTLSAMLISMFLAPFLINAAARFAGEANRNAWDADAKSLHEIMSASMLLRDHVIVCGYGRTGRRIGQFLHAENIQFVALDIERRGREVPASGQLVFGNAEKLAVLKAAGLSRCRALVITYPDLQSAERILHHVRQASSTVPVIVRAADESDIERLRNAGATEVIPEVFEASLMVAAETLSQIGIPIERAMHHVHTFRAERYARPPGELQAVSGAPDGPASKVAAPVAPPK